MKKLIVSGVIILATVALLGCPLEFRFQSDFEVSGPYPVLVDYTLSLKEMIEAGNYDWVFDGILNWKIIKGKPEKVKELQEVQVELIHLYRWLTTKQILQELDELGYRPATLAELCAFEPKHPHKQEGFPIVALGTVWKSPDGRCFMACLSWDDSERRLSLRWVAGGFLGHPWGDRCRFLAVRKDA